MKLKIKAGTTSLIQLVMIYDSSVSTGAGLTGLLYNSASLACYYKTDTGTAAVSSTLVTITTLGTYAGTSTNTGFKEVSSANMPGVYELHVCNNAIASGLKRSVVMLKGAANMAPCVLEIELDAVDYQDTVRFGLTAMPNVASGAAGAIITSGTGTAQLSTSSGQVLVQSGTGTGQISLSSGTVSLTNSSITSSTFASGAITAAAIAADAIGASELAADAVAEIVNAVWDELQSGHTTAGSFGRYLDSQLATLAGYVDTEVAAIKAVTDLLPNAGALTTIQADLDDIQSRLPAALVGGRIDASVGAMASDTLTAAALAADAVTEIQSGLSTLTQANIRTAVGLASANLDTQLGTIDDYLDTEIAAIKAVTDALPDGGALTTIQADLDDIQTRLPAALTTGTADSGTTTTMVDAARTEADTDYWKGCMIRFLSGNIAGQTRLITGFTPGTDTITFTPATTQAVDTNAYEILPLSGVSVDLWGGSVVNALISGRVDSNTGAMQAGVVTATAIATGAIDADAIAADAVTEIQSGLSTLSQADIRSAVGMASANLDTQLGAIDDYIDTEIAAIKAVTDALPNAGALTTIQSDLDNIQTRLPAALVSGRMDSNIGAQAIDITIDMTQPVPTSNDDETIGDALNAARAQGFGKWTIVGTTLTLYAADGSTAVRTFTLDSATSPTSRT